MTMTEDHLQKPFRPLVVGVGASAGGLEALSQMVAGLLDDLGCAYVIAQHMSPNHRSMMAEILGRETRLPVSELVDGDTPQPNTIYIIPPGRNLVFRDGRFHLLTPSPEVSPKPSVNLMFQSMAEAFDENAVAIVLSGTGSDGTVGLRAVKAAGGVTFAQLPESAKYDGMPHSAIDSGVVDHIVTPDRIGFELRRLILFPNIVTEIAGWEQRPPELAQIFDMVKGKTRIDFSSYKLSTVLRRLQRRLIATRCENLEAYLSYLKEHPSELEALARETLISVTEFFRDRDAFRSLERHIQSIVEAKGPDDEIRVWSVGCATGEEAYSLAILFAEALGERLARGKLQVFATDIDNDALAVARAGHYNAAALAELPADYLSKYFQLNEKDGRAYEPVKGLRDSVVFARQDIAVDPPFLRMDLVVCRNVLIYFNAELQARVLSVLHYALADEGLLFLGRSETVTQQEELFSVADRRNRLYRPRKDKRSTLVSRIVRGRLSTQPVALASPNRTEATYERSFFQALAERYALAALLVDANAQILHSHGAVARFVEFPSGTPDMNLARLIVPEFRQELLTTLHRARRTQAPAYSRKRRLASHQGQTWRLAIFPAGVQRETEVFLVNFESGKAADTVDDPLAPNEHAEQELAATREHLQTMLEEMASANEEMQALTEEVQAANEELQASNEELEATNEELQATNEELISVNEESLTKSAELAAINADFESVHNTLEFPVLVFDAHLYAKRANATAIRVFGLPPSVAGQHIARLHLPSALNRIEERLARALLEQRRENFIVHHEMQDWRVYITPAANAAGTPQSVVLAIIDNTDLIEANRKTAESQEQLQAIMNHSVSLVVLKEANGRYVFANQRFVELVGQTNEEIIGKTDAQLFAKPTAEAMRKGDLQAMQTLTSVDASYELEFDGRKVWLEAVHFPIFDSTGVVKYLCTQANDISQKRHAEDQLRLAAKVFDRAGEAIVVTDASNHILTVNAAFTQITGYAIEEVIGKTPNILKSGRHTPEFYDGLWHNLKEQGWWQGEILNRRKGGEIYPEWLTINAVLGNGGEVQNYVAIFSDISAIKSSQRRIEFMATHDELTGLPNRGLLMDRLKHSLSVAQRQKKKLALLFIDLDNFKNINDTLGHDVGDLLLKEATQRLQSCVRDSDTLARLGGDEFVALLMDVELAQINQVAGRIVDFLSASFHIRQKNLFVSASVGISVYPADGEDSATLLKHADAAMYRAKDRGRNQYQFFAEEMKVMALERLTLETGLRQAIEADYFHIVYQPQIDLATGDMVGAEALLRWRDPHLGDVSPARFIPLAENAGLINTIGDMVIDKVLKQVSDWHCRQLHPPRISINVSAHQMRDVQFVDRLLDQVQAHGASAETIGIELTESVLMEGIDVTSVALRRIEAAGMSISIDDFGTGYSSLSYLKQLPIHELKVDRSFVDGIDGDGDDRLITTAIVQMAHALGMKVVAEGVETQAQSDVLRTLGCEMVQGYLYYRPLEPDKFEALLSKDRNH